MSRPRSRGNAILLILAVMVVVAMVAGGIYFFMRSENASGEGPLVKEVKLGPFDHIVLEQGEVESSSNIEIRCEVKSRNTSGTQIIWVVPEGTHVKKADVLVRLDSSALERERDQQQISCNSSEAVMINAQNVYEAALVSKVEYLEGAYKQEEQAANSEQFFAEQNLRTAELLYRSAERLAAKGVISPFQLEGDKFAIDKAQAELAKAKTRLHVLQQYTKPKMLKQFDADIATANAKWNAEKSSHDLEKKKLKDILDQIVKCEIKAPADGQVVFANVASNRGGGSGEFVVEAGVNVREGQTILKLPDPTQMQVKAKINESRVTLVRAGMPVLVRLEAFGDRISQGEVTKVNPYPEPGSWFSSQVKEYATYVKITDPPEGIRPGLNAEVRVFVEQIPEVLQVPVQGIFEHGPDFYSVVRKSAEGQPLKHELRKIKVGSSNDKFVTIKEGLKEGEEVMLDARKLVEKELPKVERVPDSVPNKGSVAGGAAPTGKSDGAPGSPGAGPSPGAVAGGPGAGGPGAGGPGAGGPGAGGPGAGGPGAGGPGGGGGGRGKRGNFSPDQMFAARDTNGDGKITSDELEGIPEQFRAGMMRMDTDSDGAISKDEFTQGMAQFSRGGGGGGGGPPGGAGP